MSYLSEDLEEGYPGALLTTIRFKLTFDNKLEISMRATTSKPTIVNLSHSSYFNLAGHVSKITLFNYYFKILSTGMNHFTCLHILTTDPKFGDGHLSLSCLAKQEEYRVGLRGRCEAEDETNFFFFIL